MCVVAGRMYDLSAVRLPERTPWPSVKNFAVAMASLYDWDTLLLDGGARNSMPGGDVSLCSNSWPCHLKVIGPGTISASAGFSISCDDTDGCTGMEFDSVNVPEEGRADGFSLHLSGASLETSNSTFSGARVTVRGAKLDMRSSTCVDCNFVLERGAQLFVYLTNFLGGASSCTLPLLYLYSGTSASIESCKFENLHSSSSGAVLLVMGSQLEVVDSTFSNCSSGGSGGAIHGEPLANQGGEMRSSIVVMSSIFSDCQAAATGGGVSAKASGTSVYVSNSSFARCRSKRSGGAIHSSDGSPLTVTAGTSFLECSATEYGGAVTVINGGYIVLESSTFRNCTASNRGGAVFVSGGGSPAPPQVYQGVGFGATSLGAWGEVEEVCT